MEAVPLPTPTDDNFATPLSQSLDLQRGRVREFLAAQQRRWKQAEAQLLAQIEQLTGELAQRRAESRQTQQLQETLDQRQEELLQQHAALGAVENRLREEQAVLACMRQQHEAQSERLASLDRELESRQAALEAQARQLAARNADTETRRRLIARQLRARHADQLKDIERSRAELAGHAGRGTTALEEQLETARYCEKQLAAELQASAQRERELAQAADALRSTCDDLREELSKGRAAPAAEQTDDDLQRRYQMAMDDLRELKARNAELQRQLAQARASGPPSKAPGGKLDWEAEKRRILAALESDFDEHDTEQVAERLKIEEVIRKTEEALTEKDGEIAELQHLLEEQSSKVGSMAVGAAALGELLDHDAIIREERENLKRLQEHWREKLRESEVELSVERAKIARQQAEIAEKLRALESQGDKPPPDADSSSRTGKPVRGRWLARLGLKDLDEG